MKNENYIFTVSGSGKTQDEAKQSAFRSALEQAFGAFISSKTEILNDQIVADQMASVANGNIQSFSILNESPQVARLWRVKTIKRLLSKTNIKSTKDIRTWKSTPKVVRLLPSYTYQKAV